MRVLNRLDVSGSFGLGSTAQDQFVIGSPDLENNDISTDNLKVWANADFKNNVTLGSNSTDIIDVSGTLVNHGGASLTGSFSGSGENLNNIPNTGLQNYQINLNGSNLALGGTGSVGTLREITGGSNITIGLVNATTRSVSLNDNINLSSVTASFSGSGALINNLTASNITNFSADTRKQISGTGVISYDPVTGVITYTGAGGEIYTTGNITGSGTSGNPLNTKDNVTFTNVTSSNFTGSRANLDYIDFVSNNPAFSVGRLHYDTAAEILKFDLPYENTELNIGKQLIAKVKNNTAATIAKGKVVYVNGAQAASENLYVVTASWEGDPTSANTIGFTMSDLAPNDEGYIILEGILEGVSTSGYTAGSLIYLSSSGDFTQTKPTQPNHAVRLGHIVREQDNNGSIFVRIQNGFELDELHDVLITSPQNYDLLVRDTDGLWKNTKTLAGNYTFSGNNEFTGSLNGTASYANNADLFDGQDSSLFALKTDVSGAISGSDRPTRTEVTGVLGGYAKLDAINTFSAAENIFNNNVTINGTASIAQLNTLNQQSLVIGDKYITILSGSSTHSQMDGAGILFGSGSSDPTTGDQSSVAHIVYRMNNPADFNSDYIEVYPQLRSAGVISGSNLTGSNTGDETTATIKTKLGAAATAADGYLTSTDWNTFNNKQDTVTLTTTGTTGSATLVGNTLNIPNYIKYIPPTSGNEFFRGLTFNNNSTTVTTLGGITAGGTYSSLARSVASTDVQAKQIRMRVYTASPASGKVATIRGTAALWYIGGGFRYVCGFGISDTSYASTARQFYGMSTSTSDLAFGTISGIAVKSLTNLFGFGSDAEDTNLQFIYNDGSGTASSYDLGSSFPANRSSGAALTNWYTCQIYNIPSDSRVFFSIKNQENGAYIEDFVDTDLPAITAALNFHAARSMNTSGGGSGQGQFDLGKLGVFSINS